MILPEEKYVSSDNPVRKIAIRFYGVREAKENFAKMLREAQEGVVIVLNHSRPVALIIGIEGVSMEEVTKALDMGEIGAFIENHRSYQRTVEES